ncbi:MAG: 30S ribosomal protein S27ae [Thermoproteales archaeon]|nr:30S ribosomal protein S27ae [Thermoproteales archaeon]
MTKIYKLYEYDYNTGKITLKNKLCPRCGSIMAHHLKPVERWHCGKCGYTIFVTSQKQRKSRR